MAIRGQTLAFGIADNPLLGDTDEMADDLGFDRRRQAVEEQDALVRHPAALRFRADAQCDCGHCKGVRFWLGAFMRWITAVV